MALNLARSLRFVRRIATAIEGAASFDKPAGCSPIKQLLHRAARWGVSPVHVVSMRNRPSAVFMTNRSSGRNTFGSGSPAYPDPVRRLISAGSYRSGPLRLRFPSGPCSLTPRRSVSLLLTSLQHQVVRRLDIEAIVFLRDRFLARPQNHFGVPDEDIVVPLV